MSSLEHLQWIISVGRRGYQHIADLTHPRTLTPALIRRDWRTFIILT